MRWPTVLMLGFAGLSLIVFLFGTILLIITGAISLAQGDMENAAPLFQLGAASAVAMIVLAPAVYLSLKRLTGWNIPALPSLPHGRGLDAALFAVWLALIGIGQSVIQYTDLETLIVPVINAATVIIPIVIVVRTGLRDLKAGSPERRWGVFSLGLVLGPLIIAISEILLILTLILIAAVFAALNPQLASGFQNFGTQLNLASSEEEIINLLSPYLFQPVTIVVVLGFISVCVPIIEEILKPIGVWLGMNRILTPSEGFVMGILSGAGYALFESLGATSTGLDGWAVVTVTRAGTDVLHILNSGLMGWALVSAWHERKYLRLALTYLITILIHGIWNALSVAIGLGLTANIVDGAPVNLKAVAPVSMLGLVVWFTAIVLILAHSNKRLREAPDTPRGELQPAV
jgi:hypothetical protein